jgi:serpin B
MTQSYCADHFAGQAARLGSVHGVRSHGRRRRVSLTLAATAALALTAASCGVDDPGREVRGRSGLVAPDPATIPATVASVNGFATDLYRAYRSDSHGNFSLSPYVVAYTLGMVRAGAVGETRQQLDQVLHLDPGVDLDRGFATLAQTLASRNGDRRTATDKGRVDIVAPSALWGPRGTRFKDPFLDTLSASYGTGMRVVDVRSDPDAARATINNWARDATDGSVTQLLPRGVVTDQTSVIDASAFSFQAPWATPFMSSLSGPGEFRALGGGAVPSRTIGAALRSGARFATGDGWQALELPYLGNQLSMLVVVPDAGTFDAFESGFDADRLRSITDVLHPASVDVRLPRFQFQTDARLDNELRAMGLTAVFDDQNAELSGISADGPLTLSSVSQQSYLDVSENGTGTQTGSIAVAPTDDGTPAGAVRVTVDRPFVVMIRDIDTGLVLSLGRVVNPN